MPRMFVSAMALLCLAAIAPASATTVSPVNIEMTPTGLHARAQITVSNTSANAIAIEPTVESTVLNEKGAATHGPADDDFLIVPAQVLIPPGGSQVFRVQWVGDPELPESRSYLVTMNQLPVQGLRSKSALAITVSFGVAVNVAAANVSPLLELAGATVKPDGRGKAHPVLLVDNPTATHALLRDASITLAADTWTTTLPPGALANGLGTGLVQPHKRRQFILPIDLPDGVGHLTASIDYTPKP